MRYYSNSNWHDVEIGSLVVLRDDYGSQIDLLLRSNNVVGRLRIFLGFHNHIAYGYYVDKHEIDPIVLPLSIADDYIVISSPSG